MRRYLSLDTNQRPQQFRVRILIFMHEQGRSSQPASPPNSCLNVMLPGRLGRRIDQPAFELL